VIVAFRGGLPLDSARVSYFNRDKSSLEGLRRTCYNTPYTASSQRVWTSISMSRKNDQIAVRANSAWISRNGHGRGVMVARLKVVANQLIVTSYELSQAPLRTTDKKSARQGRDSK
jgi:hypothetical protein